MEYLKIGISAGAIVLLFVLYYFHKLYDRFIRLFGAVGIIISTIYISWRIFFTLPPFNNIGIIFAIILIVFECLAFFQSIMFRVLFATKKKVCITYDNRFTEIPIIDVIVSTYNEPVDIIKRTIVGCLAIDYPPNKLNIYLGDDGRREEIKNLAKELGINYVTRENNLHAKAGNINNVMKHSNGEFILLLDADMIPSKKIIKKLIYFFQDTQTAFVQSPQVFYNEDPYQYNLYLGGKIPNEQDFFMRVIEEKRALHNVVLHVGTNAIFRRKALETIGGIPTGSITEDMATGMLLQNEGYKTFFVNEVLAIGLSPDNLGDLIKQRDRWCRGNVQVFKKFNPMKMKGLSFLQRLFYTDGFLYWMFGIQKLVFMLTPLLYLIFRVMIFKTSFLDLALFFLPHYLGTVLFLRAVAKGVRSVFWAHIYELALSFFIAAAFTMEMLFSKSAKFNVTPKGSVLKKNLFRLKLALPLIILFGILIYAIAINVPFLYKDFNQGIFSAVLINLAWCIYNALGIFVALFLFMDRRRMRNTERIELKYKFKALCQAKDNIVFHAVIEDISEKGMKIIIKKDSYKEDFIEGESINLFVETIGQMEGKIKRITNENSKTKIGIEFGKISLELFKRINEMRFDRYNSYMKAPSVDNKADEDHEIISHLMKINK